jgi:FAD/FMN-containing dehydrogenase
MRKNLISRRSLFAGGTAALGLSVLGAESGFAAGSSSWAQLRRHLGGDLVLPGEAFYSTAKQLFLTKFDPINPRAVAYCESPQDVALCLKFAQDKGFPVAARSGGHSAGGYSTTSGLVVDVSRMNAVTVGASTTSVGAGAQNVDVLNALAPAGLAAVGGAGPTVGAGFIQGGGLGFLTRPLGVACDAMRSAQIVLADGRVVTASPTSHPDLYWAVRGGGGGNFGVLTAYTIAPAPVTLVNLANLGFGYDQALDVLSGYTQWLVDAPRTIGGAAVVTLADAAPGAPAVPLVLLVSTGTAEELASEVARLLDLTGAPTSQNLGALPYSALMNSFYGCAELSLDECHRVGTNPVAQLPRAAYGLDRSRMFTAPMPTAGWSAALAAFDSNRRAGQFRQLQISPLNGAVADLDRNETAFVHRDSLYTTVFSASNLAATAPADDQAAAVAWATGGFTAIDPYSNGETYQNFIDPHLPDWRRSYYAENYPRLVRIKNRYDPDRVFRFAQGIG